MQIQAFTVKNTAKFKLALLDTCLYHLSYVGEEISALCRIQVLMIQGFSIIHKVLFSNKALVPTSADIPESTAFLADPLTVEIMLECG